MDNNDAGKFVLRMTLGVLLMFHGVHKILTGIEPVQDAVAVHHLPDFLAYFVYVGEVLAPMLVILGALTRVGAALVIANMIVALLLAHSVTLAGIDGGTGGYVLELQAFYLFCALAIALFGAGRIAIMGPGRLN
ncbi:MAG: DoxX family protein [Rhizomicrobium sp.]